MSTERETNQHRPERSRFKWVLIGFLLVAGYFLITEHRAHVIQYLPFVLLLACPLLHLFMHRGHKHGGDHDHEHRGKGDKRE